MESTRFDWLVVVHESSFRWEDTGGCQREKGAAETLALYLRSILNNQPYFCASSLKANNIVSIPGK